MGVRPFTPLPTIQPATTISCLNLYQGKNLNLQRNWNAFDKQQIDSFIMDLLGNYSSSDDDDDSSSASERSKSPPTPIVKKSSLQPGTRPAAIPSPKKPAAVKGNAKTAGTRRGKKLISLHSVLPAHVLEQLTKSETAGSFEDSSDEEEETGNSSSKAKSEAKGKAKSASKDEGIASFLSALGSAKTNGMLQSKKKIGAQDSGKLGAAFVSVTSTTTTRTKKDGTQSSTTVVNERSATPTHQGESNTGSPSHYKPLSLSPRTAFHPFRTAGVAAAPPVPGQAPSAAAAARIAAPPQPVAPAQPPTTTTAPAAFPDLDLDMQSGNSRSKKRQLQKALRAGNMDQVLAAGGNVTNVEQVDPTAFVPAPETYAVPQNGVRVVATQMYNPKVGGDVQVNAGSGRARGKNQINQLMASAANFELQQARSGQKTSNQRAGAKRKYGW